MSNLQNVRMGLACWVVLTCGCFQISSDGDADFQQSIAKIADSKSEKSERESRLIADSKLDFANNARLLYHFVDYADDYEEWLIFCPPGTHPLAGAGFVESHMPNETVFEVAAARLKTRDLGAPLSSEAQTFGWYTLSAWRATVLSTEKADYVDIIRTKDYRPAIGSKIQEGG